MKKVFNTLELIFFEVHFDITNPKTIYFNNYPGKFLSLRF